MRPFRLRVYHLKPSHVGTYMKEATDSSELRKSFVPLRLFSLPEVGGELNVASHLYFYQGGMKDRAAKRKASAANEEWAKYVASSRSGVAWQESRIYAEAPKFVLEAGAAKGGKWEGDGVDTTNGPGVYEYRKYQLPLGYTTVPNFLEIYAEGVKVRFTCAVAGREPNKSTQLNSAQLNSTKLLLCIAASNLLPPPLHDHRATLAANRNGPGKNPAPGSQHFALHGDVHGSR